MGGGFDGCASKVYGPAKRRTASADRSFPVGCGRNAAVVRTGGHPWPPMAAAATAKNGSRPAFLDKPNGEHIFPSLEKSNGEQRPPSSQMSRLDASMGDGAGGDPVRGEAVEERTKPSLALMPAGKMLTVGISKLFGPAKMRRVSADRCFPPGCGRIAAAAAWREEPGIAQEVGSERTTRNLGHQKSPGLIPAGDMLSGEISIVFGPAKKRGVSAERRFPAGCGRTAAAAAARREEPGGAREGSSKMAARRAAESHVKRKPEEAKKGWGSKVELHKAKVVHLGNQAPRSSTWTKHKLPAVRHFPVGTGTNAGELLERSSHGGQARGGGRGREGVPAALAVRHFPVGTGTNAGKLLDRSSHVGQARGGGRGREGVPAALARGKRPPLAAKSPLLLPRGGVVRKRGEASKGATAPAPAPALRADRIVMVLMAASRCPWRGGRSAR